MRVDAQPAQLVSAPAHAAALDPPEAPSAPEAALRRRYTSYRKQQARALMGLLPRDAVRSLLHEAVRAAAESAAGVEAGDSLALLADFCEGLLPLPPFEVWRADFQAHRSEHLAEEPVTDRGPSANGDPVTVALRPFTALGDTWYASLDVRPDAAGWRGRISYHRGAAPGRTYRTADVFRESDAETVRRRFLEFDGRTLEAFLRSVLP